MTGCEGNGETALIALVSWLQRYVNKIEQDDGTEFSKQADERVEFSDDPQFL